MNLQIRTKLLIFSYAVQIEISRFVKKFSDVPQSLAHKGFQTKWAGESVKKSFFGRKLMYSNGLSPNEIHCITTKFYPYTAAESLKSTGDSAVGKIPISVVERMAFVLEANFLIVDTKI